MARARNIKPALFKNELLGVADPLLTLLFQSLWTLADREGRLEDRPLRIKAETFPYREGLDVNGYLTELQRLGFVVRYSVDGEALIQVVNFKKHQTPHNTEKPSELPAYDEKAHENHSVRSVTVKHALSNVEITAALPPDSLNLIPDSLNLIPDSLQTRAPVAKCKKPSAEDPPTFADGLDVDAWLKWVDYRKQIKKPLKPVSMHSAQKSMAAMGGKQMAAVDHTISNGWTGLYAPEGKATTASTTYGGTEHVLAPINEFPR